MTKTVPFGPATLYTSPVCPFAQRVTCALAELGILNDIDPAKKYAEGQLEIVNIDLKNKPDWYAKINPRGKVPAMKVAGVDEPLIESSLITEFVLQAHGSRLLRTGNGSGNTEAATATALERYRAQLVVDALGTQFLPAFFNLLKAKDEASQKTHTEGMDAAVNALGALLPALPAGQTHPAHYYVLGVGPDAYSIGDLLCAPFVERLAVLEHYRGYRGPASTSTADSPAARFDAWKRSLTARPSVRTTTPPLDYLVEAYRSYTV